MSVVVPFSQGTHERGGEAALGRRWAAGVRPPLRLEDGRSLRVVYPGEPGGASGPDFRGAVLDAGGDLLRGDVELHLVASGWRAHGHHRDPAYGQVVLHVVGENDGRALATLHGQGRAIPILVLRGGAAPTLLRPPCAFAAAAGADIRGTLARMGERRLRIKAARVAPLAESAGAGQALFGLLLETLGGPANRAPFAALARRLPLAALMERGEGHAAARALVFTAELKGAAAGLSLRRVGLRPMASPGRRLEAAGALFARLWPAGGGAGWPLAWAEPPAAGTLRAPGIGVAMASELMVNAVLPVALATGAWPEGVIEQAFAKVPSPGTYGRLGRLEGWLGNGGERPFGGAQALQGGLLLQADYCARGACGRCPLSAPANEDPGAPGI